MHIARSLGKGPCLHNRCWGAYSLSGGTGGGACGISACAVAGVTALDGADLCLGVDASQSSYLGGPALAIKHGTSKGLQQTVMSGTPLR